MNTSKIIFLLISVLTIAFFCPKISCYDLNSDDLSTMNSTGIAERINSTNQVGRKKRITCDSPDDCDHLKCKIVSVIVDKNNIFNKIYIFTI